MMNEQNFGERGNTSERVERTDPDIDSPAVDSNSFAYKGSVLAGLIQQTPMGRGVVAISPMNERTVHEDRLGGTIASNVPEADAVAYEAVIAPNAGSAVALLNQTESEHFRTLWNEIQGRFVDEPRSAVQQADALVAEVIEKIAQVFANEHGLLEEQWKEGQDVSTENLRKALQHYRSFFNRLVV